MSRFDGDWHGECGIMAQVPAAVAELSTQNLLLVGLNGLG
jgi:hypothetical protein